jgi:hypothetical protein
MNKSDIETNDRSDHNLKFPVWGKELKSLTVDLVKLSDLGQLPPNKNIFLTQRAVGNRYLFRAKAYYRHSYWEYIINLYRTDSSGHIVNAAGYDFVTEILQVPIMQVKPKMQTEYYRKLHRGELTYNPEYWADRDKKAKQKARKLILQTVENFNKTADDPITLP